VLPLNRGPHLLDSAVRYALAEAAPVTPRLLSRPTPCPGWDLEALLEHLCDSVAALRETVDADAGAPARPAPPARPGGAGPDLVERLRGETAGLLTACAAGPAGRVVDIGDRRLTAGVVAVTGAIEITVHGWDISAARGAWRPVPPGLAAALLPAAAVLITAGTRPGLFAGPVRLPATAGADDQLVAFTGRQPRPRRAPSGASGA